jgi:hypothetical protein
MELSPLTGDLLAFEVQYWAFVYLELHPMEALAGHGYPPLPHVALSQEFLGSFLRELQIV